MWRHKNSSFLNYGIGLLIQKEQDEKKSLAKNELISANFRGDISTFKL